MSVLSSFRVDGRRALITGSSRGIGKAIGLALAEAGADIVVHSGHDVGEATTVVEQIERLGRRATSIQADLTNSDCVATMREACARLGSSPDILVLNAAVQFRRPWSDITRDEIRTQIEVNFVSALCLAQAFVPGMVERCWGRVLVIGSIQEQKPHPDMAVYASTKGALDNLVRNLAKQVASAGVTVNTLSPGVIHTERNASALSDPHYRAQVLAGIPAGRLGDPSDCAAAALLLCSDAGAFITGANIPVDGGGRLA